MKKSFIEKEFIMLNSFLSSNLSKKIDQQLYLHGISFTEYMIMHHLNNSPLKSMRRIDLAKKVNLSASGVTRLIAPMEKNKLVEKEVNPRDARVSLVKLSEVGERVYLESSISFENSVEIIMKNINKSEILDLIEISKKLLFNL